MRNVESAVALTAGLSALSVRQGSISWTTAAMKFVQMGNFTKFKFLDFIMTLPLWNARRAIHIAHFASDLRHTGVLRAKGSRDISSEIRFASSQFARPINTWILIQSAKVSKFVSYLLDCFIGCVNCEGPNSNQCTKCDEGLILVNGTCRDCTFSDGLYINDDKKCVEVCGDGIFLGLTSECDDHNTEHGDGCSATCTIEYGYECKGGTQCREIIPPNLLLGSVVEPNVLYLEFEEDVFLSSEGKQYLTYRNRCNIEDQQEDFCRWSDREVRILVANSLQPSRYWTPPRSQTRLETFFFRHIQQPTLRSSDTWILIRKRRLTQEAVACNSW